MILVEELEHLDNPARYLGLVGRAAIARHSPLHTDGIIAGLPVLPGLSIKSEVLSFFPQFA
jgi:hypothetical protein